MTNVLEPNYKPLEEAAMLQQRVRVVLREPAGRMYHVHEQLPNGKGFVAVSRGYAHSTSAYAAMGKMVQKDIAKEVDLPKLRKGIDK